MASQKIISKILINIAYLLLMFIGKTSGKSFINYEIKEKFAQQKIPIIYAFWHNRIFYPAYLYRKKYVGIIVSQHKDGDYIAEVMKKCKLTAMRGSSTRGGLRALVEIINYVKKGFDIAFTPDGPQGPKYTIKNGVLLAALKTGFPIVSFCWNAKRKIIFNSWDNFIFPLPFNKFIVAYGKPIYIKSRKDLNKKKQELYKAMMDAVKTVDNYKF